ncbi:11698_t:CDS:10 [Funneliformis mosseae]|uniref:11698_t:CDS:1 n=1 Tax=Funneliformis mosseae TaxID=27381 RepID=A0A9N9GXD7_FUNMO|nr:11698_t:CDS:10 [Funneliformis mosseae]
MTANPAEVISSAQKSTSQLLFFDTLTASNFSSDELPTECIRFHQRVVLSEIRVVPKHFRPFKGSRKNDHVGQTSPNKFDLNLLIHKTLTADSAKPPEKRPPTLPLHPLTISFDEKKGFLSYDVTLLPEATTRFIILRGNYQHVTLCIYGRVMESSKPQNIKSKDKIGASTICKKSSSTSIMGNNIEIKVEENSLGNISIKKDDDRIDEMDSTEPLETFNHDVIMDGVQEEQNTPVTDSSSVQILDELKATEGQFVTTMEEDAFYLDDGHRDTNSDADKISTLLNKDRAGAFRILSPANAVDFSVWNLDEKLNKDILVYHTSPDEPPLSRASKPIFKKAWDELNIYEKQIHSFLSMMDIENKMDINSYTEGTSIPFEELLHQLSNVIVEGFLWAKCNMIQYEDELNTVYKGVLFALDMTTGKSTVKLFENGLTLFCKLCSCGEEIINSSMIQTCLNLMVSLLKEQFVSSTLQIIILRGLLECIGEPRVAEEFLRYSNNEDNTGNTLYKTFILPMLQIKNLPLRILHLLQAIVHKVAIYEACTDLQQLAEEKLQPGMKMKKKEESSINFDNQKIYSISNSNNNVQKLEDVEFIIDRVCNCLHIVSKAALYYMALHSGEDSNQNYPPIFSFKYLTSCHFFPAITIIMSSHRVRSCSRFHEIVNSIGRLCVILMGAPISMLYLVKQLQQPNELFGDCLLIIWSTILRQHDGISIEDSSEPFSNSYPITDINELRRTPGIGDIWFGFGQSTTDYEDSVLKKARRILSMQSCGAIGAETGSLDNCIIPSDQLVILLTYQLHAVAIIERLLEYGKSDNHTYVEYAKISKLLNDLFELTTFNVGKQAVASAVIYLDALSTILSLASFSPAQEFVSASVSSTDSNALGRIPLELLEIIIKFSSSFPFLLTPQIHELVNPFISSESHLRSLWDPIAAFHETGNIQGVIDVIKHQKDYPECLRDHNSVNQILVSLRLLMSYTYNESGILHILKARMDDFSGFDNGDSFLVFLLRLLNHAAEVLSDLSDFVVYADAEHQSTSEYTYTSDGLNSENHDESKFQEMSKSNGSISENRNDHSNNNAPTFIQSIEVFELRRELLDLVWYNLILIRRLLRSVYGDPEGSAAKRHFRDIYGENESPDDPSPSQKKSMVRICVEPWLMLVSALDHLDGRLSDQLGATSLISSDQPLKNGQSAQIARIRGLILGLFGLLTQIVIEEKPIQREEVRGINYRARFFSDFTGRHVVRQLVDFIFDGPNNFLSGLHILSEILPTPLLSQRFIRNSHCSADNSIEGKLGKLESDDFTINWQQSQQEARILRDYWIKQLLPLRDDLIYLTKSIAPSSSKILHMMLRTVICQLVDLDFLDIGIGKGIVAVIVKGVRESFEQFKSLIEKSEKRNVSINIAIDDLKGEESEMTNDDMTISSDIHIKLAIFGRWMSLLTSLCGTSSGRSLLLDSVNNNLLEWAKQDKNDRIQIRSLLILQKIAETEIGALFILSKKGYLQLISNMMAWVPDLLRSQDLRVQDLTIAYRSIIFILTIIRFVFPEQLRDEFPFLKDNLGTLPVLFDSYKDAEIILKLYESIEQHIIELPYESHNIDEEMVYDHLCQSVVNVIKRFKDNILVYIREINENEVMLNIDENLKKFNIRISEVINELNSYNISIRKEVGSISIGVVIDDYPDFPFYDIVDDFGVGGLFSSPDIEIDFEVFAKEMLPNFQFHKKMKISGDSAAKGRKLLKTRTLSKLGGIAYESNARRNLGGGKTYQKNEFRSIHNNRKANTSRPPSVHVDDFMSGKIPVNQQHPDMLSTTTATTIPTIPTTVAIQQKKTNATNRAQPQNKRGGIITATPNTQLTTNNRGRGRRPSTGSTSVQRGVSRGASNSGRGVGVGRGSNTTAGIVGGWDMGSGTWTPSIPLIMGPPMNKYMEFERRIEGQRDYTRYEGQTMRTGYYDNQYYSMPSPMTPYDRPPVQQSAPGMGPRIKNGSEPRRTVPQEWAPRSMTSQPTRRPERPFGRR